MRPRKYHRAPEDISNGLKWSLAFHFGLITTALVKTIAFPSQPILYIPSLRVDLVDLPDQLKNDLIRAAKNPPPPQAADPPKKEEPPPQAAPKPPTSASKPAASKDEMVVKPAPAGADDASRKRQMKNALERVKSLAKIANQLEATPRPVAQVKGNMISKGTSLSGDARETSQATYFDSLRDRLHAHWALPIWLARQNLSAQVQIQIDSRGALHQFRFVRLSGNPQFDEAVKRTLQESQPYPPPPPELAEALLTDGILVGFPL